MIKLYRAAARLFGKKPVARVAFNMKPVSGPWGGSSPFVAQLAAHLERRGYEVCFDLTGDVDVIVLVDPREGVNKSFGPKQIADYKDCHPGVKVLHRVNECDKRKNTGFMDGMLKEANTLADYTVFISGWVRDYHAMRWFDTSKPHRVVYNGADCAVFNPIGAARFSGAGHFRIVTHHWSSNRMKGFDVYEHVDRLIASGALPGVELWVIGRWPDDIVWKAARTFPPTTGDDLAVKLRQCHAYIIASLWEPCGMSHVEGAQCGLPLIYHEDGGGIVEAGLKYGVAFRDDVKGAILKMRNEYKQHRRRLMENMPSGDRMCIEYADTIQRLAFEAHVERQGA